MDETERRLAELIGRALARQRLSSPGPDLAGVAAPKMEEVAPSGGASGPLVPARDDGPIPDRGRPD
jgi:hypothetical protein